MRAVNLIPAEVRERTSGFANRSHGVAQVLLGVLVGVAVLAFLYGSASHQIASKQGEAHRVAQEAQSTQARAASLAPFKAFVAMRETREQSVKQLVDSRFDWAHALRELGRVLPQGTSISSLSGSVGGPAGSSPASSAAAPAAGTVASATPPGSVPTFAVSGCAVNQAVVARTVTQLELADGVKEVTLGSSTKSANATSPSSSSCPVSFSLTVTFQPLPSPPATSAVAPSASSTADTAAPSSAGSAG